MSTPVIELKDVTKTFNAGSRMIAALSGLSVSIESARLTGLVGPDGAGKTTLMRLLTGLLKPDSGSIRALGLDVGADPQEIQARVGYMPQRFGLYEDLSVLENLTLYADLQGLAAGDRQSRFDYLMEFTGLGPFRSRLAGQLSGGMKQKLGLACTLVRPPRLMLLDEPSVGVDPVSRRELWDIVRSLVADGISVLWATAYLDEAEHCDDVLLLSEGRLLDSGKPKTFSERLEGRTFAVRVEPDVRRAVLTEILGLPHVIDAIIKGRDIRVLIARQTDPDYVARCCENLKERATAKVSSVAPVFEDAFIALLKEPEGDSSEQGEQEEKTPEPHPASANPSSPLAGGGPDSNRVVIEVDGLMRKFGDFTAVDNIDFKVTRGEIFGLLGPNGAGKSTTFKMLCGLLPPSGGKALVLDIDLLRAAAKARGRIGYMAQKFSLYGNMTVLQNLQFFASAYGLAGKNRDSKVREELLEFGLDPYADAMSETLPLGYKQRLALASAIMHEPGILFLDEPTSGVDPLVRREFWARINAMAAAGVTVLVTTHFLEEAEYCDRVGIIYRGRLVATGTPEDLKREHRSSKTPDPTLEDAFIDLIERYDREQAQ